MSLLNKTLINSIYSFLGYLCPIILFLISTPYMVHKLGVEEYGIWVLVNSLVGSLGILNLGIGDANIRYISEYHTDGNKKMEDGIIGNSFLICAVLGAITLLIGVFAPPFLTRFFHMENLYKEGVILIFRILVGTFVLNIFILNAISIFKAVQRYDIPNKLKMFTDVGKFTGIISVLYFGYGLKEMAYVSFVITALGLIFILVILKNTLPEINLRPKFEGTTIKLVFKFSFYSLLTGISNVLKANSGQIIIGRLIGISFIPYFFIPLHASSVILNMLAAFASPLFPLFSSLRAINEKDEIRNVFIISTKYTAIVGFGIYTCMFVLSHPILSFWINNNFADTSNSIFRILILGYIFNMLNITSYFILMGFGRVKIIAAFEILSTMLFVALSLFLTPYMRLMGVALAFFAGQTILTSYIYFASNDIWLNNWFKEAIRLFSRPIAGSFLVIISSYLVIRPKIVNIYSLSLWIAILFILFCGLTIFLDLRFFRRQFNSFTCLVENKEVKHYE